MNETDKNILHARPRLRIVSPLAYWIVFILGVFNIALGVTLFLALDQSKFTNSLLIVNSLFTFKFWGLAFFTLGVIKLYALFKNNWHMARNSLIAGVVFKSTWAIALAIRTFVSPGTIFLDLIWITLALLQAATYIFFMPPSIQPDLRDKNEEGYDA